MRKIYKNQLPKNMEVKSFNTKVVNGEIIVEAELKEIFQPKDGDFCVTNRGCIFIFNANYQFASLSGYYVGIDGADRITINRTNKEGFGGAERFATESEKSAFLKRLKKELHKKWNPETKKLEDIRWKPKPGEYFWYITSVGEIVITKYIQGYYRDEKLILINNCFKTSEIASIEANKFKELLKNSKAE